MIAKIYSQVFGSRLLQAWHHRCYAQFNGKSLMYQFAPLIFAACKLLAILVMTSTTRINFKSSA